MSTWEDKPFYWIGPDGKQKVLCWVPYMGYALGHTGYRLDKQLPERVAQLEKAGYPYDIVQLALERRRRQRPARCRAVRRREELEREARLSQDGHCDHQQAVPRVREALRRQDSRVPRRFHAVLGRRGGVVGPRNGASTARPPSGSCRPKRSGRMLDPAPYPADEFAAAWRNVILYDEHTWGAYNSITEPDAPFVKGQWKIKQAFALDADAQSRELLAAASAGRGDAQTRTSAVDVFNTSCWPRTDLVVLSKEQSAAVGDVVADPRRQAGSLAAALDRRTGLPGQGRAGAGRPAIRDRRRQSRRPTARRRPKERRFAVRPSRFKLDPASGAIASLRSPADRRRAVRREVGRRPESLLLRARRRREGGAAGRPGEDHRQGIRPAGGVAAGRVRRPRLRQVQPRDSRRSTAWIASTSSTCSTRRPCGRRKACIWASPSTCPTA